MNNLKKLRLEFGLSTRELAVLSNTTNPLISMIESCVRILTKKGYVSIQDENNLKKSQTFADHYFSFMSSIDDEKSKTIIEALPHLNDSQKDIIINLISTWTKT